MATHMQMAELDFVDDQFEGSQMVAILDKPYSLRVGYAKIPEPADNEIRVKVKWTGICGSGDTRAGIHRLPRPPGA